MELHPGPRAVLHLTYNQSRRLRLMRNNRRFWLGASSDSDSLNPSRKFLWTWLFSCVMTERRHDVTGPTQARQSGNPAHCRRVTELMMSDPVKLEVLPSLTMFSWQVWIFYSHWEMFLLLFQGVLQVLLSLVSVRIVCLPPASLVGSCQWYSELSWFITSSYNRIYNNKTGTKSYCSFSSNVYY